MSYAKCCLSLAAGIATAALWGREFQDGERVVFAGDSITHHGTWHKYVSDWYATRYPDRAIEYFNCGHSGGTAETALKHFAEDIAAARPTAVTLMFGMNDVGRGNYRANPSADQLARRIAADDAFRANLETLIRRTQTETGNPFLYLITPSPYDDSAVFGEARLDNHVATGCTAALGNYAEIVRAKQRAAANSTLVEFYSPMHWYNTWRQANQRDFTIVGKDRVHPAAPGNLMMAFLFLEAQGADGVVSETEIDAREGRVAKTRRSAVEDLKVSGAEVSFAMREDALPMPIEPGCRAIANERAFKFAQRFNRETLKVKGLTPGYWELTVDGERIGEFASGEFANGLELAALDKMPQYRQAQRVVQENAMRAAAQTALRDMTWARRLLAGKADPDDLAAVLEYVRAAEGKENAWILGMFGKYAENWPKRAETQARMEQHAAKTRELAKPVKHSYRLKLVKRNGTYSGDTAAERAVMSDKYWQIWNAQEQAKIDADIDAYRKADKELSGFAPGETVGIEQTAHEFYFGAHIFNYGQLGSTEANRRYAELYGTLFNSATVAFYWKPLEPEPNHLRFAPGYADTEDFWNSCENPKDQPHWRRPPPDQVVQYLKSRGVRMHGHTLIWGDRWWHQPFWVYDRYCPENEKEKLGLKRRDPFRAESLRTPYREEDEFNRQLKKLYDRCTENEIAELAPVFTARLRELYELRVKRVAERYGDTVESWDVCNESAAEARRQGKAITGFKITKSSYGLMPGDYTLWAFRDCERYFPSAALLNINDYSGGFSDDPAAQQVYLDQVRELREAGAKIDVLGSQMHLFDPNATRRMAQGAPIQTPQELDRRFALFAKADLPIHLSEITIAAPSDTEEGRMMQAVAARNLYRKWFSVEKMMGITWWNVTDGAGAPGEPVTSGLFDSEMNPKPAYFALNRLINHEWKTALTLKADEHGKIRFRGFKGKYRASWGNGQTREFSVGK